MRITIAKTSLIRVLCAGLFWPLLLAGQTLPQIQGKGLMPDEWLFSAGQPFHFRAAASGTGRMLSSRSPTEVEAERIRQIQGLFEKMPSKVILLGDGDQIMYSQMKPPARGGSLLLSASMDKSITAFSAGVAICEGKISFTTRVKDVLPDLDGSYLGGSTLRDNLMMASGALSAFGDSQSFTPAEIQELQTGKTSFMALLKGRIGQRQGWRHPGELFDYKSQDPLLVGMMVSAAYGLGGRNFRQWQADHFFNRVGLSDQRIQGNDQFGYAWSEGNTRLTLNDWARLAIFILEQRKEPGCYGDFIRQATTRQIKTDHRFAKVYDGYGYFVWTDNAQLPNSYSAIGYGGQAIVWSTVSDKFLIIFSNSADSYEISKLARLWLD